MSDMWYARPVFFVADVRRALDFYLGTLGFVKKWPADGEKWTVCQVNRQDCEIILCEDRTRQDRGRLFIELNDDTRAQLRREVAERGIPIKETWWGYDCIQIDDPDRNELLFAMEG